MVGGMDFIFNFYFEIILKIILINFFISGLLETILDEF